MASPLAPTAGTLRPGFALTACIALTLLATACGGTTVVVPEAGPTSSTASTAPEPDPDPPPTTEEAPNDEPQAIVDRAKIRPADLPADYTVEADDDDSTTCDGRELANDLFPPALDVGDTFTGDHVFSTGIQVFDDAELAADSYAFNLEDFEVCDGQISTDLDSGEQARFSFSPTTVDTFGDVDEYGATRYSVVTANATFDALAVYARQGNVVFIVVGTDDATTIYLEQLMTARLNGSAEPAPVTPTGTVTIGPGDPSLSRGGGSGDPTVEDIAGDVRSLAEGILDGDGLTWIQAASDEQLAELTTRTCEVLAVVDPADRAAIEAGFEEIWLGSDPSVREDLEPFTFGQVLGVMMGAHCPDLLDLVS